MLNPKETQQPIPFIRELCKHKSEAEIRAAEENFRRYLFLVKQICEEMNEEQANALLNEVDKPGGY